MKNNFFGFWIKPTTMRFGRRAPFWSRPHIHVANQVKKVDKYDKSEKYSTHFEQLT